MRRVLPLARPSLASRPVRRVAVALLAALSATAGLEAQGPSRERPAAAPLANPLSGLRTERVEADFDVVVSRAMTLDDARRAGVDEALAEAVRQVVGTKVDATQQRVNGEGLEDRFLSVALSSAAGRVVDYKVMAEGLVSVPDADGRPVTRYRGRVSAMVAEESGKPDAGFAVGLSMNRPSFMVSKAGEGEEMIATVTSTRDAWVTLFVVTEDTVDVILPNAYAPENRITAARPLEFPSARQRAMSMNLTASLPAGRDVARELIVAVATKAKVPFGSGAVRASADRRVVATAQGTVNEFQQWLVRIPLDERAVAYAAYEIRRAAK